MIALYQAGQFPFDRLIKFYDFGEINRAIADASRGDTIKPVLRISPACKVKGAGQTPAADSHSKRRISYLMRGLRACCLAS